jgi:hypothetical protein
MASFCGYMCPSTCGNDTFCSASNECISPPANGTCLSPIDLGNVSDPIVLTATGNLSLDGLVDQLTTRCGGTSGPELVYAFHVPPARSFRYDIRLVTGSDMAVSLLKNACALEAEVACDDGTFNDALETRIIGHADAGVYYVVVDAYDAGSTGAFTIEANFSVCVPVCQEFNRACGDDGCGGTCGACGTGEQCDIPNAVVSFANYSASTCVVIKPCDPAQPVCGEGCREGEYCTSDCQCLLPDDLRPDLALVPDDTVQNLYIQQISALSTCGAGCVSGSGLRRVLRFTVATLNQGRDDFWYFRPDPDESIESDEVYAPIQNWNSCRNAWVLSGHYSYRLLRAPNLTEAEVTKDLHCLVDSKRVLTNNDTKCHAEYTNCGFAGLSPGWANVDAWTQECQWVDVTDVAAGTYYLHLAVNPTHFIDETTYTNNDLCLRVSIPAAASFRQHPTRIDNAEVVPCNELSESTLQPAEPQLSGALRLVSKLAVGMAAIVFVALN